MMVSGTAAPPGTCPIHGYHGSMSCPTCCTSAGVYPLPLRVPEELPAPQGWQCPVCKSVMAPFVAECLRCSPAKPSAGAAGPA